MQINPSDLLMLVITGTGTITVPVCLFLWNNRMAVKKELKDRQARDDERHTENIERFNQLLVDRQYHPPHSHAERSGPLTAEGVKLSPLKINGGR